MASMCFWTTLANIERNYHHYKHVQYYRTPMKSSILKNDTIGFYHMFIWFLLEPYQIKG